MSIVASQPEIRFNTAGPNGMEGISYLPKTIAIRKTVTTTVENDDFMTVPAGTYVVQATAVVLDAGDANTEVTLGTDGTPDQFITTTALNMQTVGNAAVWNTGAYFAAADVLRVAVGGTPVSAVVEFTLTYFELAAMLAQGVHFDL